MLASFQWFNLDQEQSCTEKCDENAVKTLEKKTRKKTFPCFVQNMKSVYFAIFAFKIKKFGADSRKLCADMRPYVPAF